MQENENKQTSDETQKVKPIKIGRRKKSARKSPLKEYTIQFVLVFIAVILGFIAEGIRDDRNDRVKEIDYVTSLIEDAEIDVVNYTEAIKRNIERMHYLDSLAQLLFEFDINTTNENEIYRLFRNCIVHPDVVHPIERTMIQLKNSGGMRLISSKKAADNIVTYDDFSKKLFEQQAAYELYMGNILEKSTSIMNYKYVIKMPSDINKNYALKSQKLIETNPNRLIEFGNVAELFRGIVFFYNFRLTEGKEHATQLISELKKEYDLK